MNKDTIKEAVAVSARFIECVKRYDAAVAEDDAAAQRVKYAGKYIPRVLSVVKSSGALRRASMDLTRALAEMRKPG